jgi:succinate dehydrogenase / fumarate reductase, cytochrome b subunit
MSNSAILKSSIAKKWWMALTGLFLCLFLVGHLLGNLQLIFIDGEEGKQAFNEYAYFMTHNPFIKVLSYVTYLSILFHAIDGFMLTIQNKKARPQAYAYVKQGANTSLPARYMAILGSTILIFIVLHMANFWGRMHFDKMPLHKVERAIERPMMMGEQVFKMTDTISYYLTTKGDYLPDVLFEAGEDGSEPQFRIEETKFINNQADLTIGEGYKDLHSLVFAFFGHDKSKNGFEANSNALVAVLIYVVAMIALGFHLWHGFASAFQSLGVNHRRYNAAIKATGKAFSVLISAAFAIIPILIFLSK